MASSQTGRTLIMIVNQAAEKANEQIRQASLQYRSTTEPLLAIHDTLKDMKNVLNEILELLRKRV